MLGLSDRPTIWDIMASKKDFFSSNWVFCFPNFGAPDLQGAPAIHRTLAKKSPMLREANQTYTYTERG